MIPRTPLADLFPDPNHPQLADLQARYLYLRSFATLDHTSYASANLQTYYCREPTRLRSVQVGAVSGGTVTVTIKVRGASVFPASSVSSGGPTRYPEERWYLPAGVTITSELESVVGVPVGTTPVVLDLDSFMVTPREQAIPKGKDRLFPSRRREAARINQALGGGRGARSARRTAGSIGSADPQTVDLRPRPPIRRKEELAERNIAHRFRPIR